jgi:hypothetical protein
MARPKIEIDKGQFEKLCGLQCTKSEIAGYFDCSEDTIERWCHREYKESFAVVFGKKRVTGKISLRRSQFRMAETNPTMAIWLGKQYLGQAERQEIAVSVQDDDTIKEMEAYFDRQKTSTGFDMEKSD